MRQISHELYKERKHMIECVNSIIQSLSRYKNEITWLRNQYCVNSNQYTEYLYQIRHKEITIAFAVGRMQDLVKKLHVQDILYG